MATPFQLQLSLATYSSSSAPNRYALAIHTASSDLGFAISNFAGDSRCQTWSIAREVSNYLHLYLNEFIQPQTWADLTFLAVAKGPGGFTGTRLGVVTARTLAQQLDLPLFAISTLAAVAWTEFIARKKMEPLSETQDIAVQMPAHRGEIHGAIYSISGEGSSTKITALHPDSVIGLDRWQQLVNEWNRPLQLVQAEGSLGATAQSLLELAHLDWQLGLRPHWSEALPFYGQSPV